MTICHALRNALVMRESRYPCHAVPCRANLLLRNRSTGESGPVDYLLTSTVQVSKSTTASHRARARGQHGKGGAE